jgi:teichuronic acid biosynthesis glycosyltransferase TuaH
MIVVADVNAIWRRKPFEALAEISPVVGLSPRSILSQLSRTRLKESTNFKTQTIYLPPGWASKFSSITSWVIQHLVIKQMMRSPSALEALVLTSPHYLDLAKRCKHTLPLYYYCSDDYSFYQSWGAEKVLEQEAALVKLCTHSFFVSEVLARRAVDAYKISAHNVSISPNATDPSFLKTYSDMDRDNLLAQFPEFRRPLVGVVGTINERLDFSLIKACADLNEVGSVVMVGGIESGFGCLELEQLRHHPKCVFVGPRPHQELPLWMNTIDMALIPYKETPFNRSCSPMRLYDHLASGRLIVSNRANPQIEAFGDLIFCGYDHPSICDHIKAVLSKPSDSSAMEFQRAMATRHTWADRAREMYQIMQKEYTHERITKPHHRTVT